MGHRGRASAVITSTPDRAFSVITDIDRLPTWNRGVRKVIEQPDQLAPGAEWVVEIHALGQSWPSRSRVTEVDGEQHVFAYRSQSDDGNPSFALWRWTCADDPGGTRVTVEWDLNPRTFWRRWLLVRVRRPGLAREVQASLERLGEVVTT